MTGVKCADLSLFRDASIARKTVITHTGGDTYIAASTPSDAAVMWGESFGTKERKFLKELLGTESVCFSLKDTYQIHCRTLWHPNSVQTAATLKFGLRRQGKFALLLHDLQGDLTTSWTWAKFIRPLFRKGFSVISVDLPGFGRSSVASACSCPLSVWQGQEAHVISKIMEELSVAKCQVLAVGRTCGMLLHVLQSSPHRMAGEHVLVDPIFDRNKLFHHVGIDPPPGAQAGWQDAIKAKQQTALKDLLRTTAVRLWCLFDRDNKYKGLKDDKVSASKQVRKDWQDAADTFEMLSEATKDEHVSRNLTVTEITKNDLCEAQIGKRVPIRFYVPSRHLKASVARFMSDYVDKGGNGDWQQKFQPNHIAFQKGKTRTAQKSKTLGHTEYLHENRLDEDSDDSDDSSNAGPKIGLPTQKALALLGGDRTLKDKLLQQQSETEKDYLKRQGFESQIEALAIHKTNKAAEAARQDQLRSRGMRGNASDSALPKLQGGTHTLSAAASIAEKRLTKSGARANKLSEAAAEARRDLEHMMQDDEFEHDLSYGVRKMYLDAFQASVQSFTEEQEKEYAAAQAFHARTAMRVQR